MSIDKNDPIEIAKANAIFTRLKSVEELNDWFDVYLDIRFPQGVVYPDSTHGPADAIWRIYELMATGQSKDIPEVVMLSARDAYKTAGACAAAVLCMVHFRISIGIAGAILSQSDKSVQYVTTHFSKIKKYLEHHGWSQSSENKRKIEWKTETQESVYLRVLTMSRRGMNSEHLPMLFCVDGKTRILSKNPDESSNRKRKFLTARGLYYAINRGEKPLVLTMNEKTKNFEFKKALKASLLKKDIYRMSLSSGTHLDASLDHPVYIIGKGYVPISNISIGDSIAYIGGAHTEQPFENSVRHRIPDIKHVSENPDIFNEIFLGSLLGDGGCYRKKKNGKFVGNASFNENHCMEQDGYLKWKGEFFKQKGFELRPGAVSRSGFTGRKQSALSTRSNKYFNNFVDFRQKFHINGTLEKMGPLALAVWYQDDGNAEGFRLNTQSFSEEQVKYLVDLLNKKFDLGVWSYKENKKDGRSFPIIEGNKESKYKLFKIAGHLFHECMQFKLDDIRDNQTICCKVCKKNFISVGSDTAHTIYCDDDFCQMVRKERIPHTVVTKIEFLKHDDVFDFTIEDNHNFFANGILTHNCDEIDLINDEGALAESRMIPTTYKNFFPLTVSLSTRKYAGGLMEQKIQEVQNSGGEILRWNILDVTERITSQEARVNEPKVVRYLKELPMENLSEQDWKQLDPEAQQKYMRFEAYAGIAEHKLLPVMKNYLVDRPQSDKGNLYKPVASVLNNFRQTSPDFAAAQLLCQKPSRANLVYPRFDDNSNSISIPDLYKKITGDNKDDATLEDIIFTAKASGVTFIGGADWGFTDFTSLVIIMLLPGGEAVIVDNFVADKLEIDDIRNYAVELNEKWNVDRWYVDQAYPAYISMLKKAGLKCPEFTKVVQDGIAAVQSKIVDSTGVRRLFILRTPNTQKLLSTFGLYRWDTDAKGDIVEGKPYHDNSFISDIQDSIRYPFQVLFGKSGKKPVMSITYNKKIEPVSFGSSPEAIKKTHNSQIMTHVQQTTGVKIDKVSSTSSQTPENPAQKPKKKIFWSV